MAAAAAALQQASGQAQSIVTNAFALSAYNNYAPDIFRIQANIAQATQLAQNKITTNQSNAAEQHQNVVLGSAGLAGYGVSEMRSQLIDNISTTASQNQASLVSNLNDVSQQGVAKLSSQQQIAGAKNQASTYASIGGSAFGLVGSIIGGLYGLTKGGKDSTEDPIVGRDAIGRAISGTTGANTSPISQPFYTPQEMTSNLNIGWVGGHVGNPTSVGTTNFVNQTTEQVNNQNMAAAKLNTPATTPEQAVANTQNEFIELQETYAPRSQPSTSNDDFTRLREPASTEAPDMIWEDDKAFDEVFTNSKTPSQLFDTYSPKNNTDGGRWEFVGRSTVTDSPLTQSTVADTTNDAAIV